MKQRPYLYDMEIIKTKSVKVQHLNLDRQKDLKRLHAILIKQSGGMWDLLHTNIEGEIECILTPLSDDIEAAGYNWKEYQNFQRAFYGKRLCGSTPVGFKYKG